MSSAEIKYREAFERLKKGKPDRLKKGTKVSQNNVAKEAGSDPSALKKQRFPELVREIQTWVNMNEKVGIKSQRKKIIAARSRSRSLQ